MDPREQMLVQAACAGDSGAFSQLYQDNYQPVYALAYASLREQNAAAGVLRDTFAAAWTKLRTMPAGESFSNWVLRLCSAQCDAAQRSRGASPWFENAAALELLADADPETFRLPQPYTVQPELMARLDRAVAALPDRQRRAVTLYYLNGLTLADAAAVLGSDPARVRSDLSGARREIVRRLRAEENAAGETLNWTTESETKPFRAALAAQAAVVMIAGGTAGVLLNHLLASLTGGTPGAAGGASGVVGGVKGASAAEPFGPHGAKGGSVMGKKAAAEAGKKTASAAGKKAAASAGGKLAGMSTATKVIAGVTAAAVVAGGGYGVSRVIRDHNGDKPSEPVESSAPLDGGASAKSVRVLDKITVYNPEGVQLCTESYDYDENLYVIRSHGEGELDYGISGAFEFDYEYDDEGRILSVDHNGDDDSTYEYNVEGRLVYKEQTFNWGDPYFGTDCYRYEYDSEGNRTKMTWDEYSESGPSEAEFSCTSKPNASGGVDIEMELISSSEDIYPYWSESYDAKGRLIREAAEGERSLYYHDEQGVTLQEFNYADGGGQGLPSANMNFVLIDPAGNVYHTFHLGMGGDAEKSYDSDGYLTRLEFSDGSYAEFAYRDLRDEPEPEPEPEPSPKPADTRWKQAYKDYLTDLRAEDPAFFDQYYSFALIYVNDDDIPELVIHTGVHADGGILCTCDDGEVVSESISAAWNADYLERENRFLSVYGISGVVIHDVYEIRNGRIVKIASGTSYPDPNDPNTPTDHPFVWNEEDVTQEEYDARLNQAIDTSRTKTTGGAGFPVGAEVFDYIDRF